MSITARSIPFACMFVVACGSTGGSGTDGGPNAVDAFRSERDGDVAPDAQDSDGGIATEDGGGMPGETLTAMFPAVTLQVGEEQVVNVVLELDNAVTRQVRAVRTRLPVGSHHMIVERTTAAVRLTPEPSLTVPGSDRTIFIAQMDHADLVYPDEAALELEPHEHIFIEIHMVNYQAGPIEVGGTVTFELLPVDAPRREPVHVLFTGSMGLVVPGRASGFEFTSFHPVPTAYRIFALTSHTHRHGTAASIHRARSESDLVAVLHERMGADSWAEPPLDLFGPALTMETGEGLRLLCRYDNPDADDIPFGLLAEQEMCFLWAYYY